ncbi:FlgO family outer membrane protein [Candidatus Magnetominusculus dajiuhuensis]|uniref:FlgO family outer membrane protein n=1 Tax=Candidatus Magnetominusculus dajiuhuensis TaxID=3137712 RepID=UPI003B435542
MTLKHKTTVTSPTAACAVWAIALTLMLTCGCSVYKAAEKVAVGPPSGPTPGYSNGMHNVYDDLDGAARDMANGLSFGARIDTERVYSPQISPILVTTFVDINDLRQTSPLGRAFSELLMTYLQRNYFNVIEMRMGNAIDIDKKKGELVLTRDVKDLAARENAMSVLAGTYTITGQSVIFNGRIINLKDSTLYSAWSTRMVETKEIKTLLKNNNPGNGQGQMPDPTTVMERPAITK